MYNIDGTRQRGVRMVYEQQSNSNKPRRLLDMHSRAAHKGYALVLKDDECTVCLMSEMNATLHPYSPPGLCGTGGQNQREGGHEYGYCMITDSANELRRAWFCLAFAWE